MKTTKTFAWCIIVCMLMSLAAPILAYANTGITVISYNGTEITPKAEPYENSLGLMANAEDMAKLFSLEYDFNSKAKFFHIYSEEHGDIYLVHNATKFASGDNEFDCAPNFYFENGIPMVEVGFFCEMFGAEYELADSGIVVFDKSEEIPPSDEQLPPEGLKLYEITDLEATSGKLTGTVFYSCGAPSGGLEVDIILAKYNRFTFIGTYKATTVKFAAGETSKTFSIKPMDILGTDTGINFAVYYSVPSLGLTGYLDDYGDTIRDNDDLTDTSISDSIRFFAYHNTNVNINIFPLTTISGTISFDKNVAAPEGGLDVTLNLVSYSDVRNTNYGQSYRNYGYHEKIGTVNLKSGEKSKSYSFEIPEAQYPDVYPNYIIYYSTTTRNCIYTPAFLRNDGNCEIMSYYYDCPDNAKMFDFTQNTKANIKLLTYKSYGEVIKGSAGDNITWKFDEYSGTLTLTGRGTMYDRLYYSQWRDYREKIKKVVIGDGITNIGDNAFALMSSLESVTIPNSVKVIESQAFRRCTSLVSIEMPEYLTDIGSWAFEGCSSLTSFRFPDSINPKAVGIRIFNSCSSLSKIYAPGKLASTESDWKGSNYANVVYDCNVIYKVNGRTVKAEEIVPGTVINAPAVSSVPSGGKYYLTVNGKIHTEKTITITGNTIIDEIYLSPSAEVNTVIECDDFRTQTTDDTYSFSCNAESVSNESFANKTAVVALYDSIGNLVGLKRIQMTGNTISGTITGENAASYKIMIIDTETLKPSAFGCEGNLD